MANPESVVWVGGLSDDMTPQALKDAFETFGPIIDAEIPNSTEAGRPHRGFGFVTFEESADAGEAIFNMKGAVLNGKVLDCNVARKRRVTLHSKQAVWADQDAWYGPGGGDEVLKAEAAARVAKSAAAAAKVQSDAKRKFAAMSQDQVADLLQGKRPKRDDANPYDLMAQQKEGKAHTGINFGSYGAQPYNHYGSAGGGGSSDRP